MSAAQRNKKVAFLSLIFLRSKKNDVYGPLMSLRIRPAFQSSCRARWRNPDYRAKKTEKKFNQVKNLHLNSIVRPSLNTSAQEIRERIYVKHSVLNCICVPFHWYRVKV